MPSVSAMVEDTVWKESIVLSARRETREMAKIFAQVKALEDHVNPPYLRGEANCQRVREVSF